MSNVPGYKHKKNKNKLDVNRLGNNIKNNHNFVAIYSNSNNLKPK